MQRLISNDHWIEIRKLASKAKQRKAAIAFATQDLIGFRSGDVLIVNASEERIGCGDTDAKLLKSLFTKKVAIYSCPDLHAKVLLFDDCAVIGSANMSQTSKDRWIEAGLVTDQSTAVAGVASFIEQLVDGRSRRLGATDIEKLCSIKVERRGGAYANKRTTRKISKLGERMWLVSATPCDYSEDEERDIENAAKQLNTDCDDLEWLRMSDQGRFTKECRQGDMVIQMWRNSSSLKRCSAVYKARPVLLKQVTKNWTRFYFPAQQGKDQAMNWSQFIALLNRVGYNRQVKPTSTQEVKSEFIDLIKQNWSSAARKKAK